MRISSFLLLAAMSLSLLPLQAQARKNKTQKKKGYTKEDIRMSRIPRVRLSDRRLSRVWKVLVRQYKHMYSHAAADGYIWPYEMKDLLFQRRILKRIYIIDKQNRKILIQYRKLRRRRLSAKGKKKYRKLQKSRKQHEAMIRRFACRYLKKYRKKRRSHCKKQSI